MKINKYLWFGFLALLLGSCTEETEEVFDFKMNGKILPSEFLGQPFAEDDSFVLQTNCSNEIVLSTQPLDLKKKNFYWKLNNKKIDQKTGNLMDKISINSSGLNKLELCNRLKCITKYINCIDSSSIESKTPIVVQKEPKQTQQAYVADVSINKKPATLPVKKKAIHFSLTPNDKIEQGKAVVFKITDSNYAQIPSLYWLINYNVKLPVAGRFVNYTFNETGIQTVQLCSDENVCSTSKINVVSKRGPIVVAPKPKSTNNEVKPSSSFENCELAYLDNIKVSDCEKGDWHPSMSLEFTPKQDLKINSFKIILNEDADVFISIQEESKSVLNNESYFLLGGTARNQIRFKNLDLAEFYFRKNKKYLIKIGSNDGRIYDWTKCRINESKISNNLFDLKSSTNSIYDLRICI